MPFMNMATNSDDNVLITIDIDGTSILQTQDFSGQVNYNDPLFNALVKKNVTAVYCYSDMIFSESRMTEMRKLLAKMESQHLQLLGVVTPCDLAWHIEQAQLNSYFEAIGNIDLRHLSNDDKTRLRNSAPLGTTLRALIDSRLENLPIESMKFLGYAYAEAAKIQNDEDKAAFNTKSLQTKNIYEILTALHNLEPKALMALFTLQKLKAQGVFLDAWLFFDDRIECLQGTLDVVTDRMKSIASAVYFRGVEVNKMGKDSQQHYENEIQQWLDGINQYDCNSSYISKLSEKPAASSKATAITTTTTSHSSNQSQSSSSLSTRGSKSKNVFARLLGFFSKSSRRSKNSRSLDDNSVYGPPSSGENSFRRSSSAPDFKELDHITANPVDVPNNNNEILKTY